MEESAVEWLIHQLITENEVALKGENYKLFEIAKEMEKQHIENAWTRGNCNTDVNGNPSEHYVISSEQYYNETFKTK